MSEVDAALKAALEGGQRTVLDPAPAPIPQADLIAWAKRGIAAEERVKDLERKLEAVTKERTDLGTLEEDFKKLQDGDVNAFHALCRRAGIPQEYAQEAADEVFSFYGEGGQDTEDDDPVETWKKERGQDTPTKVSYGDLDPEMRALVYKMARQETDKALSSALDNDEIIGYYMKNAAPKQAAAIREAAQEFLKGGLAIRKGDFTQVPEIIPGVIQRVRQTCEAFPIQKDTTKVGLGPSPSEGGVTVPSKPPEHVSSWQGASAFGEHINAAIAYEMAKEAS